MLPGSSSLGSSITILSSYSILPLGPQEVPLEYAICIALVGPRSVLHLEQEWCTLVSQDVLWDTVEKILLY